MNDCIAVHELCTVWAGDNAQSAVEAVHAVCRWWAGRQTEMAENRPNLAQISPEIRPDPTAPRDGGTPPLDIVCRAAARPATRAHNTRNKRSRTLWVFWCKSGICTYVDTEKGHTEPLTASFFESTP